MKPRGAILTFALAAAVFALSYVLSGGLDRGGSTGARVDPAAGVLGASAASEGTGVARLGRASRLPEPRTQRTKRRRHSTKRKRKREGSGVRAAPTGSSAGSSSPRSAPSHSGSAAPAPLSRGSTGGGGGGGGSGGGSSGAGGSSGGGGGGSAGGGGGGGKLKPGDSFDSSG